MSVSVCAGWKYCSITISPLACSFWLVLNVWCSKAFVGDAGTCKPKAALSCGSAMRVLVFSWASTLAPAACRLALLSRVVEMPVRVGHRLQRRISQPIERFFKENELLHQGLSPMELPSATDR
jgi:hypothetical protein